MYSLSQLKRGVGRGLQNPSFFGRELNRLFYRRLYRRPYNTDGIDVMAADWDTLLVLDACRYDLFAEHTDLPGSLERRVSRGSHTTEFLRGNVDGRTLEDTVYVTASPMLYRWRDTIDTSFHEVINVWQDDGWDDEHNTVLPETTTAYARRAAAEYPNKRLLVHYLQPHYPFIGADDAINTREFGTSSEDDPDVWGQLMRGSLAADTEAIWAAYRQNLSLVEPHIEALLEEFDGRTVVAADHGNMIAERSSPVPIREWGHPPGIYTDELVEVPWLVHESGPRPEITSETGASASDAVTDAVVEERLAQLGYAE